MSIAQTLAALACVSLLGGRLAAQDRDLGSATPLHVAVQVGSLSQRGDTITLSYVVSNVGARGTGESLWMFEVDAPAPASTAIGPSRDWLTKMIRIDRPTARWTLDADVLVAPGQSTPPLTLRGVGVTDLVHYWAVPDLDAHPPVNLPDSEPAAPYDPMKQFADSGLTVGIVPPPTTLSVSDLLTRLRQLLQFACTQQPSWITGNGCHELGDKLDQAGSMLQSGKTKQTKDKIGEFIHKLGESDGKPDKDVSYAAYALLLPNALYLNSRL